MKILSKEISLNTKKEMEIVNITGKIEKILSDSKLSEGIVSLFAVGSTCALTTIEFEPGLLKDFPAFLEKIIPKTLPTNTSSHGTTATGTLMLEQHCLSLTWLFRFKTKRCAWEHGSKSFLLSSTQNQGKER